MAHDDLIYDIEAEAERANARYGPYASTHEAYGVLAEEMVELLDAIHSNSMAAVEIEATQIAAVALRLARACRNEAKQHGPFTMRSIK